MIPVLARSSNCLSNRNRKRGSNMSLAEAQRTGYKTFVSLKGDATAKESKKGWLNPFSDE